jgi:hypothetical protein
MEAAVGVGAPLLALVVVDEDEDEGAEAPALPDGASSAPKLAKACGAATGRGVITHSQLAEQPFLHHHQGAAPPHSP